MLNPPTTHWPRVIALWLCGVCAAMQFAKISFLFSTLQAGYAISAAQTGLLLSTVGMVGLVLGVTVGLLAPAIGYRRLLLAGLGLGAAMALLQSLAPPYGWFWLTRVLEGASQLAVVVAAPTLIVQNSAPQHRSIAMGLWSTFVGVAFALTAALGGWVVARFQPSGLLLGHAIAMALAAAATLLLVRPDGATPPWPRLAALPRLHARIYTQWATVLPGACFFFYTLVSMSLLTFLPPQAGPGLPWLAALLPLVNTGGTFVAGWLAQYLLSPARLVRLAFAAVAGAGLALWLCGLQGWNAVPAALLLMAAVGLSGGAGFALVPYLSQVPAEQAQATGAVAQLGNLGATLGPPVFAALIARWGAPGLALPVAVCGLLGLAVAGWGVARWRALKP
jgi:AAHS family 3-hydroxyphenylpropionic acid transporter